jgi:hypothetical protein
MKKTEYNIAPSGGLFAELPMKNAFLPLLLAVLLCSVVSCSCGGDDDDASSSVDDDSGVSDDDAADDSADDSVADDVADDSENDDTSVDDSGDSYPESCPFGSEFDFDLLGSPMTVPYPNNLYTLPDATTPNGIHLNVDENTTRPIGGFSADFFGWWLDSMNTLDGFSTLGYLFIPVTSSPDWGSLPDTVDPGMADGIFAVVIDQASPHYGEFVPMIPDYKPKAIRLQPWRPMRERTRYALVATRAVRPMHEECYRASQSMRRIYIEYTTGRRAEEWNGARYMETLDILSQMGLDPANILSLSEFTTLSVTKGLDDARQVMNDLETDSPPVITDWALTPGGGIGLAGYGRGWLSTPIFKNSTSRAWEYDGEGNLEVDRWENIPLHLSLPAQDAYGAGQPYPIIVFGSGILSTKESLNAFASNFAQHGLGMIAMDAVCHGERCVGCSDSVDEGICFYDLFRPLGFRDNWRETVANYMWLIRAVKQLGDMDLDENGIADFDVSKIYYLGHSMGTIMGGVLAAVEENVSVYAMHSAGGYFISVGLDGPVVGPYMDFISQAEDILPGIKIMDFVHDAGVFAQNVLDQSDPVNYLIHLQEDRLPALADHDTQLMQLGAAEDYTLGGKAGGYYCRAGGWAQFEPFVWDVDAPHDSLPHVGSGFLQFPGDEHNGIFENNELGNALRDQVTHYIRTAYDTGEPEIANYLW